ncbi:MAG: hypothetical protein DMF49_03375 [Acidobacteria bacterium]|nr:MAG: hypothetical protein DMF49_03375 [Acidobacteriota bacterium]
MVAARLLFWVSAFLLLYVYLGYPALMRVWARLRPAPPLRRRIEPSVSVLLVAHDEDPRIAGRIENLLALDYPPHRIEILVASDGSTDGTARHARGFEGRGVRVLDFRLRRGKAAALNDLAALAGGEIFVMADSSSSGGAKAWSIPPWERRGRSTLSGVICSSPSRPIRSSTTC